MNINTASISGPEFKDIVLHKLRVCSEYHICDAIRSSANFEMMRIGEHMIIRLSAEILSEEPKQIECSWPRDWWQHFKQRWFPKWALKKWPVAMEKRVLEARTIYPELVSPRNEHRSVVRLLIR